MDKCEDFDNYTHNCEDYVSKLACKQVVFPCGWNNLDSKCYWFEDNKRDCKEAANEVACLIADREDQECEWNQTESIESSECKNVT